MPKLPLVSVLTPTYGRPRFLNRAIQQFLAYTYPNKEMIVIDDSPRPQADVIRHASVKYVWQPERIILGQKHNVAVANAQGEILVHQDDDDIYSPRRLQAQLEPIVLGKTDITGFSVNYVLDACDGQFYRFKPGVRFNIVNEPDARVLFQFHDATSAYHRRVLEKVSYPLWAGGEKLALVNHAVEAGYRHQNVENNEMFVYVRHAHNTWQYRDWLIHVATSAPRFVSPETVDFYMKGVA